ncbi:MAG: caspase family protein [Myxococcaceae bacterium]
MITSLVVALALTQAPDQTLRRLALIAGANDGGSGRVQLRYATTDARAMSKVLTQLGGVDARDVSVVEDPTPVQLEAALDSLASRLAQSRDGKTRLEVFFYYSGHSDEEGLLLKGQRLSYARLRSKLDAMPAEVRIAVLDSCASGALTLLKGGAARPAFLVDAATSLSGHAFLTSASADEAAQESERLKASIFTHFFLSGLRGAADTSHDGRVTLAEAYQYAFTETLARTTSTRSGPQRPGWDIQLVGTGDLVLTDLRTADARLVLDANLSGRVLVLGADGTLAVEVVKPPGKPLELGLETGTWRAVVDDGAGHVGEAKLELTAASTQVLTRAALTPSTLEVTVRRGDEPDYPTLPVDVAFVPPLSISGALGPPPRVHAGLGVLGLRVGAVDGAVVGSIGTWVDGKVTGFALGGVFLKTGAVTGWGVGGVVHVATGDVTGWSLGSVTSIVAGDLTGVQTGLFALTSGRMQGVQLGLVELAPGGFAGGQAGLANVAWNEGTGAQVGLLNVGGDVTGAQIGLLNIARTVRGTQVGLLNIAGESTAPVGLLNVITRGKFHAAVWANETNVANLALKLGSRHVYSFVELGLNPRRPTGAMHAALGLGLGVRVRGERFYGELEGVVDAVQPIGQTWQSAVLSTNARVNVGFQLTDWLAVFAGPQLATMVAVTEGPDLHAYTPWGFDASSRVRLIPGFVVGAQLL